MNALYIKKVIANNLRRILRDKGLNHKALAKHLKVTPQSISAIMTGKTGMGYVRMSKVCDFLGIKPKQLFEEGEPNQTEMLDKVVDRVFERMQSARPERRP